MKNILFFLFISIFTISCSNSAETSNEKEATAAPTVPAINFDNEQVIDNDVFYIKYPGNWTSGSAGKAKTEFVINAPQLPDGDISKESVHLMTRSLSGQTMAQFIAMTMNQYQKEITEFEILGSANNEFTFLGGPIENKAKYRHRFIEKEGSAYILGYSAGLKDWSKFEETADKINLFLRKKWLNSKVELSHFLLEYVGTYLSSVMKKHQNRIATPP